MKLNTILQLMNVLILFTLNLGCSFSLTTSPTESTGEKYTQAPTAVTPVQLNLKTGSSDKILKLTDDINITALPEIDMMYFTNDPTCAAGGIWETITPVKSDWTFTLPESSGTVSIYGKFKKINNEETGCIKFDFIFENTVTISLNSPNTNINVQGYHVFHGTCTNGSTITVESTDLVYTPEPVNCDGQYHLGISFDGGTQGVKNFKIVSTAENGFRKSISHSVTFQNNGINSGTGFNGVTADIKVDTGYDKMYILGDFTSLDGVPAAQLVRLNMDGTRDNTFTSLGFGAYGWLYEMAIDPVTHKIYVAGDFPSYGGGGVAKIVRLNPDGTRDTSFNPIAPNNDVLSIAYDPVSTKIYIGGYFTNYAGSGKNRIARLNNDGTHDNSFNVGTGFDSDIYRIQLDTLSTKIYISGAFSFYNTATAVSGLVRLNSDGSLDSTFKPGAYGDINGVLPIAANNSVWVAVSWGQYSTGIMLNIGSFNYITGAMTYPWTSTYYIEGEVLDLQFGPGNTYIYGIGGFGGFGPWNDLSYISENFFKVDINGIPAKEFQPGSGANYSMSWRGRSYADTARGLLYVVGDISSYNNTTRNGLLAISLEDGSLK